MTSAEWCIWESIDGALRLNGPYGACVDHCINKRIERERRLLAKSVIGNDVKYADLAVKTYRGVSTKSN